MHPRPILALVAVVVVACGGSAASTPDVVATTTILGDVVAHTVEGCGLVVESLMGVGQDPHAYQASPRQVTRLHEADLVVANGLGRQAHLGDVLDAVAREGTPVLRLGPHLDPVARDGADPSVDPHVWMDPLRMADGVELVAETLGGLRPDAADCIRRAGTRYRGEVVTTHERIEELLAAVPVERRLLVTDHRSLGYFAERYGFVEVGALVPSTSTLAEPTPADLEALVEAMETADVSVIFTEVGEPSRLAEAVAAELGRPVEVVPLYVGSLGPPGSGADSYLGMLETDARLVAEALTP